MDQKIQQRQIAYKINIVDIHTNELVKQDGWQPNYINYSNKKVSRVNVMGIVISSTNDDQNYIIIDDGTANIIVRTFGNELINLESYSVGTIINVIGRIREFNNEKYILPEIIQTITDKNWLIYHKKEIELLQKSKFYDNEVKTSEEIVEEKPKSVFQEEKIVRPSGAEEVLDKIKELDRGDGADVESIVNYFGVDSEKIINSLLEQGDIFETKPGKIKVLE